MNISWGVKAAGAYGWQPYYLHVPIVFISGSLSLLEPSGPVQACNGIALPLPLPNCPLSYIPNQHDSFHLSFNNIILLALQVVFIIFLYIHSSSGAQRF